MKWISVSEKFPKSNTHVLVFDGDFIFVCLFFMNFDSIPDYPWRVDKPEWIHIRTTDETCFNVTHWARLPKKPSEK
jgi:hypothetical protein